ncbi:unnamed protein product [Amoebophrya sp. A120]|nr:unnamed protein product [Amoebophrya sp. A120]|eukprot:GSA120T00003156001.1
MSPGEEKILDLEAGSDAALSSSESHDLAEGSTILARVEQSPGVQRGVGRFQFEAQGAFGARPYNRRKRKDRTNGGGEQGEPEPHLLWTGDGGDLGYISDECEDGGGGTNSLVSTPNCRALTPASTSRVRTPSTLPQPATHVINARGQAFEAGGGGSCQPSPRNKERLPTPHLTVEGECEKIANVLAHHCARDRPLVMDVWTEVMLRLGIESCHEYCKHRVRVLCKFRFLVPEEVPSTQGGPYCCKRKEEAFQLNVNKIRLVDWQEELDLLRRHFARQMRARSHIRSSATHQQSTGGSQRGLQTESPSLAVVVPAAAVDKNHMHDPRPRSNNSIIKVATTPLLDKDINTDEQNTTEIAATTGSSSVNRMHDSSLDFAAAYQTQPGEIMRLGETFALRAHGSRVACFRARFNPFYRTMGDSGKVRVGGCCFLWILAWFAWQLSVLLIGVLVFFTGIFAGSVPILTLGDTDEEGCEFQLDELDEDVEVGEYEHDEPAEEDPHLRAAEKLSVAKRKLHKGNRRREQSTYPAQEEELQEVSSDNPCSSSSSSSFDEREALKRSSGDFLPSSRCRRRNSNTSSTFSRNNLVSTCSRHFSSRGMNKSSSSKKMTSKDHETYEEILEERHYSATTNTVTSSTKRIRVALNALPDLENPNAPADCSGDELDYSTGGNSKMQKHHLDKNGQHDSPSRSCIAKEHDENKVTKLGRPVLYGHVYQMRIRANVQDIFRQDLLLVIFTSAVHKSGPVRFGDDIHVLSTPVQGLCRCCASGPRRIMLPDEEECAIAGEQYRLRPSYGVTSYYGAGEKSDNVVLSLKNSPHDIAALSAVKRGVSSTPGSAYKDPVLLTATPRNISTATNSANKAANPQSVDILPGSTTSSGAGAISTTTTSNGEVHPAAVSVSAMKPSSTSTVDGQTDDRQRFTSCSTRPSADWRSSPQSSSFSASGYKRINSFNNDALRETPDFVPDNSSIAANSGRGVPFYSQLPGQDISHRETSGEKNKITNNHEESTSVQNLQTRPHTNSTRYTNRELDHPTHDTSETESEQPLPELPRLVPHQRLLHGDAFMPWTAAKRQMHLIDTRTFLAAVNSAHHVKSIFTIEHADLEKHALIQLGQNSSFPTMSTYEAEDRFSNSPPSFRAVTDTANVGAEENSTMRVEQGPKMNAEPLPAALGTTPDLVLIAEVDGFTSGAPSNCGPAGPKNNVYEDIDFLHEHEDKAPANSGEGDQIIPDLNNVSDNSVLSGILERNARSLSTPTATHLNLALNGSGRDLSPVSSLGSPPEKNGTKNNKCVRLTEGSPSSQVGHVKKTTGLQENDAAGGTTKSSKFLRKSNTMATLLPSRNCDLAEQHTRLADPNDGRLLAMKNKKDPSVVPFQLLAYNIWMMPSLITDVAPKSWNLSPVKPDRAIRIPEAIFSCKKLQRLDVIVFCEAFCEETMPLISSRLRERGFLYDTIPPVLGRRFISSGIKVYSRHRIEETASEIYDKCSGDERLAAKGCTYVMVRKNGLRIHIFATHLQAWDGEQAQRDRRSQLRQIRSFVAKRNIPPNEPVILTGDFNIEADSQSAEYQTMLRILSAENYDIELKDPSVLASNQWCEFGSVSSSPAESLLLDYVFVENNHLLPKSAKVTTEYLQSFKPFIYRDRHFNDLSDHYPVFGDFIFERKMLRPAPLVVPKNLHLQDTNSPRHNSQFRRPNGDDQTPKGATGASPCLSPTSTVT